MSKEGAKIESTEDVDKVVKLTVLAPEARALKFIGVFCSGARKNVTMLKGS